MNYLSLFSGIEAASVAWTPLGWTAAAFAEIDPFASAVLAHHYPSTPNLGDVTKISDETARALGVDLVVGGFPCQDLSVAGKRAGLKDDDGNSTRSGLFFDALRVARATRARWLVLENVPGLYSSNRGRDFAAVVGALVGCEFGVPASGWRNAGVAVGPAGFVEWATLDAQFFGLAQRRKRAFLVCDFGDWRNRPPVLLERESMRRDFAQGRKAREDVAATLTRGADSSGKGGYAGRTHATDANIVAGTLGTRVDRGSSKDERNNLIPALARCDTTREGNRQDGESVTLIAGTLNANGKAAGSATQQDAESGLLVAHTLRGDGFDASEDGTGRGVPLVAFDPTQITSQTNRSNPQPGGPCHTLAKGQGAPCVAFQTMGGDLSAGRDVAGTLRGNSDRASGGAPCVAFDARQSDVIQYGDLSGPLDTDPGTVGVHQASGVRRLMPEECETLQGFPRGYTGVRYRGKPAADGPRYRALGNSFATTVVHWIGQRIAAVEQIERMSNAA